MTKMTIVVGLPASGKTKYCKSITAGVFDDFLGVPKGIDGFMRLLAHLRPGCDIVCNDVFLCCPIRREIFEACLRAVRQDVDIDYVFFANDPRICINNAILAYKKSAKTHDDAKRLADRIVLIQDLSLDYTIPQGAKVLPVYEAQRANDRD